MAHNIRLNEHFGTLVIRHRGIVNFDEIRKILDEMVATKGFKNGTKLVVDFRDSQTPLTADEVERLAEYSKKNDDLWGLTKWCFIASSDLTFGLSRMYETLADKQKITIHVFRNYSEADDWLGIGTGLETLLANTPE